MFDDVVLEFSYQDRVKNSNSQVHKFFHCALPNLVCRFLKIACLFIIIFFFAQDYFVCACFVIL